MRIKTTTIVVLIIVIKLFDFIQNSKLFKLKILTHLFDRDSCKLVAIQLFIKVKMKIKLKDRN